MLQQRSFLIHTLRPSEGWLHQRSETTNTHPVLHVILSSDVGCIRVALRPVSVAVLKAMTCNR